MTQNWLKARAVIAGDLYRDGRIRRTECFRLEMDAFLGRDSGPIQYEANNDFRELQEQYESYFFTPRT